MILGRWQYPPYSTRTWNRRAASLQPITIAVRLVSSSVVFWISLVSVLSLCIPCSALTAQNSAQNFQSKKLILTGHDSPDTSTYARFLNSYQSLPFNGYSVRIETNLAGAKACNHLFPFRNSFSSIHWESSWFAEAVDRLAIANRKLDRETFLLLNCNPGEVDWFDDASWIEIVDHFRIIAAAAKKSGSAGFIFDPEPYPSSQTFVPFCFERQRDRDKHTFAEYQSKARQRGRESMAAMASEFPDAKILSYFLLSYLMKSRGQRGPSVLDNDNPDDGLLIHRYNLLLPFVLGWLETAPNSMRLIDGDENAYYYESEFDYQASAHRIHSLAINLVPDELHEKYSQLVEAGSAVYLDNCQSTHSHYVDIKNHSANQILERRLMLSLNTANEYVWMYAEAGRFLEIDGDQDQDSFRRKNFKHWNQIFPGALETIARVKQADSQADRLAQLLDSDIDAGRATMVVENPNLVGGTPYPTGWIGWQPKWSNGRVSRGGKDSAFEIAGTSGGVLVQDLKDAGVQTIHVVASYTQIGGGQPYVDLALLDSDKASIPGINSTPSVAIRKIDEGVRNEIHGRWIVPEECETVRVVFGARSQGKKDDIIRVESIRAYRVDPQ